MLASFLAACRRAWGARLLAGELGELLAGELGMRLLAGELGE